MNETVAFLATSLFDDNESCTESCNRGLWWRGNSFTSGGLHCSATVNVKEVNLRGVHFSPTWDENKMISRVFSSVLCLKENETMHIRSLKCPEQNK